MAITTLGAALIGGGLLGSAALSSSASKSAGKTVSAATDRAADLENQQFERLLTLQMPAYERGEQASGVYGAALGLPGLMTGGTGGSYGTAQVGAAQPSMTRESVASQVMNTPGYQAQLDQGIKTIDRAAPLSGGMYSGRRMKALDSFGQQTFGGYYNDWLNRVGGVAGQGAQTAQSIGQAGQQNATNVGNLMTTGANARANGALNSANAWTSAIGTGIGLYSGAKGWM